MQEQEREREKKRDRERDRENGRDRDRENGRENNKSNGIGMMVSASAGALPHSHNEEETVHSSSHVARKSQSLAVLRADAQSYADNDSRGGLLLLLVSILPFITTFILFIFYSISPPLFSLFYCLFSLSLSLSLSLALLIPSLSLFFLSPKSFHPSLLRYNLF